MLCYVMNPGPVVSCAVKIFFSTFFVDSFVRQNIFLELNSKDSIKVQGEKQKVVVLCFSFHKM